jgi:hypothetical protein
MRCYARMFCDVDNSDDDTRQVSRAAASTRFACSCRFTADDSVGSVKGAAGLNLGT